jgi:hypothetical protein
MVAVVVVAAVALAMPGVSPSQSLSLLLEDDEEEELLLLLLVSQSEDSREELHSATTALSFCVGCSPLLPSCGVSSCSAGGARFAAAAC